MLTSSGRWTASMAPVSRVPSVDNPGDQSVRWEAPQVLVTWPQLPGVTWPGWLIWRYEVLLRPCPRLGRSQWPGQWNLPQDFTCSPYGQLWHYHSVAVNWWEGMLPDWLPLLKAEDNSLTTGIFFNPFISSSIKLKCMALFVVIVQSQWLLYVQ